MRVKWHGDEHDASQVKSKTIDNPGSGWEFRENYSTNDNGNSEHTIYYVNTDRKQTKIRLGEFVSKSIRDNNSVDVQVVCRITDPKVLLGAQPSDFINKVTLQKNGKDIATSSSQVPVKLNKTDKNIVKEIAELRTGAEYGQKTGKSKWSGGVSAVWNTVKNTAPIRLRSRKKTCTVELFVR